VASGGVFRPYTLVDVLGTMNQQITDMSGSQSVTGFGTFAEADEAMTATDSATATPITASTATWDNVTWGTFTWN
jgi:hypothetical protein